MRCAKWVRELATEEGISGQNINLSIDLKIQQLAYTRLLEYLSGAAVVLDVRSGEVLAYVSVPGFDSNLFVQGIPQKEWGRAVKPPL